MDSKRRSWTPEDVHLTLARYGEVVDVFIPNKVSKQGRRFAFVRFRNGGDISVSISAIKRVRSETGTLYANVARVRAGKSPPVVHVQPHSSQNVAGPVAAAPKSYAAAVIPISQSPQHFQQPDPMITYSLHKDTLDWMAHCALGVLKKPVASHELLGIFLAKGIGGVSFSSVSFDTVVINFPNATEMNALLPELIEVAPDTLNRSKLDAAWVKIHTTIRGLVSKTLTASILGKNYVIIVVESCAEGCSSFSFGPRGLQIQNLSHTVQGSPVISSLVRVEGKAVSQADPQSHPAQSAGAINSDPFNLQEIIARTKSAEGKTIITANHEEECSKSAGYHTRTNPSFATSTNRGADYALQHPIQMISNKTSPLVDYASSTSKSGKDGSTSINAMSTTSNTGSSQTIPSENISISIQSASGYPESNQCSNVNHSLSQSMPTNHSPNNDDSQALKPSEERVSPLENTLDVSLEGSLETSSRSFEDTGEGVELSLKALQRHFMILLEKAKLNRGVKFGRKGKLKRIKKITCGGGIQSLLSGDSSTQDNDIAMGNRRGCCLKLSQLSEVIGGR
ncbi:hypothetical protein Tsubulata_047206 [Turnera subulata]|uniref:RRM domain-containing protein n=1 Tax=Turnera subulata TaxID=218843 RepID=A0A9Q0FJW0_9ROSI|nr:hypothetical protein Tsubulata_047206 [Turnera subulata]